MRDLTDNQREVLKILSDYSLWRPPTFKTIKSRVGLHDNKSVIGVLQSLERKGQIHKKGRYYFPIYKGTYLDTSGTSS